jgi:hypothetical protein
MISNGEAIPGELYASATLKVDDDVYTLSASTGVTVSTFNIASAAFTSTVARYTSAHALISEDFYTSSNSLYLAYAKSGASVATLETYKSALDVVTGGYVVHDTEADVFADLGGLENDVAHIKAIRFTDASPPTIDLTLAEKTADAGALSKITAQYILEVRKPNDVTKLTGHGSGLTIDDVKGVDVVTGGGSNETFLFHADFGSAHLLDFYAHAMGAQHDTVDLAESEFSSLASLISDAKALIGSIEISAGSDKLILADMNLKQFNAAVTNGDFVLR